MKTEGIEIIPNGGLRVSTGTFARLKAFQGGGDYWDHYDLVRESLGEFLPPVQQVQEAGERFGLFSKTIAGKEALWKSTPVGVARVPQEEIRRLTAALEDFKRKADSPDSQQNAKDIIQQFRLPDISKDPALYRLCGPWWNRKLQVLWGCERTPDSSLAPVAAVGKLPIDKTYGLKRALSILALLLLFCALLAACLWGWPALKQWAGKTFNKPPSAALRLDSLDETNLIATISDYGSADPDGVLKQWHVAWGDGREDFFTQSPRLVPHTYGTERDFTISLWCVDNYGATSSPPALTNISFYFLKRQKAIAETERAKEEAKRQQELADKNNADAERAKAEARKQQELADKNSADAEQAKAEAKKQQDLANKNNADAERAKEEAKQQQDLADQKEADAKKAQREAADAQAAAERAKTNNVTNSTGADPAQGQTQPADRQPTNPPPVTPPVPGETSGTPSEATGRAPSTTESVKGAQALLFRNLEILRGGVQPLTTDNTIGAVLIVRDAKYPNAPLDVLEWVVDGKAYRTGNAQFTTRLTVAEHTVSVRVRRAGIEQTVKARVKVTGAQTQTTEPDFTVSPLH